MSRVHPVHSSYVLLGPTRRRDLTVHGTKKPVAAGARRCVKEGYWRESYVAASAGPAGERVTLLDESRVHDQLVSWRSFEDVFRGTLDAEVETQQLGRTRWVSKVFYPSNVFSSVGDAGGSHHLLGRLDLSCEERRCRSYGPVG